MGDPVFVPFDRSLSSGEVIITVYKQDFYWVEGNVFRVLSDGKEFWAEKFTDVKVDSGITVVGYFSIRDNGLLTTRKDEE